MTLRKAWKRFRRPPKDQSGGPAKWKSYDFLLVVVVIALAVFGVLMVRSAVSTGKTPSLLGVFANQRMYVVTGTVLMIVVSLVDYHFIARFYKVIYALCMALLVVVLLIGADDATETARWIRVPIPGGAFSIQPSEFAKIFIIVALAKFLDLHQDRFNRIWMLALIALLTVVPVVLIQRQPSLSASLVLAVVTVVMVVLAGLYFRTMIVGLLLVIPAGVVVYFDFLRENPLFMNKILSPYQWGRVQTFLNPVVGSDEYYQVQASLYAIGSGGLYGKGYQNNTYVPNGHNDFIFCVIGEQFGFVGCAVVLGVMGFIIFKCIMVALRATDMLGRLIAGGVAGMLLFEAFVNVSVVTALLPNTGMPFPFVSAGGTAMWVHMAAIGLVLNIGIVRPKSMFDSDG